MSWDFEHYQLVQALAKPGADIVASLTPASAHLLHKYSNKQAGE